MKYKILFISWWWRWNQLLAVEIVKIAVGPEVITRNPATLSGDAKVVSDWLSLHCVYRADLYRI